MARFRRSKTNDTSFNDIIGKADNGRCWKFNKNCPMWIKRIVSCISEEKRVNEVLNDF